MRQRHVVVVASGLVIAVVVGTVNRLMVPTSGEGWFNYAPNSGVAFAPTSHGWMLREAAIWLVGIAIWALVAWRLYRSTSS